MAATLARPTEDNSMELTREELQQIIQEELELVLEAKYHWNEPGWHYDGGYGDPEGPYAKWYLKKEEQKPKKMTDAEKKKREEIAKALERDNPNMPMDKKMRIATAEAIEYSEGKDPKKGTGKKPKGSGRRLYTDENPKDTVSIRFATVADAKRTVEKVKKVSKPYARKIQILTVGEQRAKVMGKTEVARIFTQGKEQIRSKEMAKRAKEK